MKRDARMQEQAGINTRAQKKINNKVEPFDPDSDRQREELEVEDDFMREHSFRSIDDEIADVAGNNPHQTTIGEVDPTQINVVSEAKIDQTVAAILNKREEEASESETESGR